MSHIRHYRVLPWATGPLTSLESIGKVPDRQIAKTGKSSIFWLSSSVQTVSQASTITDEAITTIQTRKNDINHWVLHSLLIVILAFELFFRDSQALRCKYLVLYAILLAWILCDIIHSMYAPAPAGSSTEHVFSYRERWRRQHPRSGGIT